MRKILLSQYAKAVISQAAENRVDKPIRISGVPGLRIGNDIEGEIIS